MDPTRFDRLSKLLATRWTRRHTLSTGGIAATGLLAGWRGTVTAQDASPIAVPEGTPTDPHPSADGVGTRPEFLFVQPFDAATWVTKAGTDDMYILTLTGAAAQTTYFSDRPERITGLVPTQQFLDGLGFPPDNPPNAALVATLDGGDEQDVLVIELFDPVYDPQSGTLTYDARVLADYGGQGLAHLAQQQTNYELPESFGAGSLFIDDCPDGTLHCRLPDPNGHGGGNTLIGSVPIGYCWSFPCCSPCSYDWTRMCASAFPECDNGNGLGLCNGDVTGGQYSCT